MRGFHPISTNRGFSEPKPCHACMMLTTAWERKCALLCRDIDVSPGLSVPLSKMHSFQLFILSLFPLFRRDEGPAFDQLGRGR